jgi:hypothetical protein
MNPSSCDLISADAKIALEMVAEQFGLQLKRGRGQYDPTNGTFTMKWTFVCETEDGIPADFIGYAHRYGLTAEDFGREFNTHNGTYSICGISPRSRKYPILAKCARTGKTYKFTSSAVARPVVPVVTDDILVPPSGS